MSSEVGGGEVGSGEVGGIPLARTYFEGVVAPLLERHAPDVRFAAARVGEGSEVLGLDDAMSRDHDWGLRLQLFVDDVERARVREVLDEHLPASFGGHPVRFGFSHDPTERLRIVVTTVPDFAEERLGFDPSRGPASPSDWLSLTGQAVLEVTAGSVFEDRRGDLTRLREALRWYPDDIWRYVVASGWHRLDQELPLLGRAGERGDDLGSRVIAARLVGVAIHLGFLLSRRWPPYSKWRGTMFARIPGCAGVAADLARVLGAPQWRARQEILGKALEGLADLQADAGLDRPGTVVKPFFERPHLHLDPSLVPRLLETVASAEIRSLPVGVGSIEQVTDNVDVLTRPARRRAAVAGACGAG